MVRTIGQFNGRRSSGGGGGRGVGGGLSQSNPGIVVNNDPVFKTFHYTVLPDTWTG